MIKCFKDKDAEKIYNGLRSSKLPGSIQDTARRRFKYLNNAAALEDLRVPPGNHFEGYLLKFDRMDFQRMGERPIQEDLSVAT